MCRNYYANPGKNAGSLTHTYTYTFPRSYILTYSLLGWRTRVHRADCWCLHFNLQKWCKIANSSAHIMLKLCVFSPVHFNSRAIMRTLLNVWYWLSQCSVRGRQGKTFLITAASYDVLPLQIVECVTESLYIEETPLPMELACIYLVNNILQNYSAKVPNALNFRRGWVCVCVCVWLSVCL